MFTYMSYKNIPIFLWCRIFFTHIITTASWTLFFFLLHSLIISFGTGFVHSRRIQSWRIPSHWYWQAFAATNPAGSSDARSRFPPGLPADWMPRWGSGDPDCQPAVRGRPSPSHTRAHGTPDSWPRRHSPSPTLEDATTHCASCGLGSAESQPAFRRCHGTGGTRRRFASVAFATDRVP